MRAMVMTGFGGPEVLALRDLPKPELAGPHDVLVHIQAAGVNPADWQTRSYPIVGYDFGDVSAAMILGLDGAGIVEAVGDQVTRLAVGDRVYFVDGGFGRYPGNYQEYKILHEDYPAKMPESLDLVTAAGAPTVLVTAWEPLKLIGVQPDDYVLIQGGAGGVGHVALQIARMMGAHVAATVSSAEKAQMVLDLGAELAIRYRDEDVGKAVREWSGKDGADVVYASIGGDVFAQSLTMVAPYGAIASCAVAEWPKELALPIAMRGLRIVFENMGLPQITGDHALRIKQRDLLEEASRAIDAGHLRIVVDKVFAFEEVGQAHDALQNGEALGRVVLDFNR